MFRIRDVIQMQPEERTLVLERRHLRTMAGPLILAGLLIAVPFFFLFPLVRAGGFGMAIFALLLAVGAAFALRVFITWDSHVLILTNRRIVHVEQTGVWRRQVREMPLSTIEQISIERRGAWDAMFHTGVLKLRANGHGSIAFAGVYRPELLTEKIEKARPMPSGTTAGFQLKPL
ncbi:PH domain-containing protein [Candidatus Uhrbacteria bacterium]|nr:PH domain-containing protein [Candidatus Uhrbacteria bacterium]